MIDPNSTTVFAPVSPTGLALSLEIVTIIMTVLSSIVCMLRLYVRASTNSFSVEDWLMLAGWLLNLAHNVFVILLTHTGIGSHDNIITIGMANRTGLYTLLWQLSYVTCGALIKSSIIYTLIRLAVKVKYRYILWTLFTLAWITWQISWPVAIFQCKPVSAAWGHPGDCTSGQKVILAVTYFVSASNILTDLATALVPIFLLRNVKMGSRLKIVTTGVLSLGVFASLATVIRMPYSYAYTATDDRLYAIGHIVLWTVLECDIGIIAGSLPMLRKLVRSLATDSKADSTEGHNTDLNLQTIGGGRRPGKSAYKLEQSHIATVHGPDRHFQDKDTGSNDGNESTRHMIHVTHEVQQESTSGKPAQGKFGGATPFTEDHFEHDM